MNKENANELEVLDHLFDNEKECKKDNCVYFTEFFENGNGKCIHKPKNVVINKNCKICQLYKRRRLF